MEPKDERLWAIAKKRAAFKKTLGSYIIVNVIVWAIWLITDGDMGKGSGIPWPAWVSLGTGIGALWQWYGAYKTDEVAEAEREYDKMKNSR